MSLGKQAVPAFLVLHALIMMGCAARGGLSDSTPEATALSEVPTRFEASAWRGFGGAAGTATLEYSIPGAGHVHAVVYDLAGREAGLVDSWRPAGKYTVEFNYGAGRRQVQSYRIEWEGQSVSGKVTAAP